MKNASFKFKTLLILFSLLSFALATFAQKKVLDHSVYDSWKRISKTDITDDGNFSIATISEQEGDSYVLISNLDTYKKLEIPRGYNFEIDGSQKYLWVQVKASHADLRQAKIKKVKDEKTPKDSLILIDLKSFDRTTFPNVKDFKRGKKESKYIAYRIDDTLKIDKKDPRGYSLVIQNLNTTQDTIKNVLDYIFSDNGNSLIINTKTNKKDSLNQNSITVYDLVKNKHHLLSAGKSVYKHINVSETGSNVIFMSTEDSLKAEIKKFDIYHFQLNDKNNTATKIPTEGIPANWTVSESYKPYFSQNEKRIILATAPIAQPKDTLTPEFEKAQLDIWSWDAKETPPQQLANLNRIKNKSYLAYFDIPTQKFYQLASEEMPDATIPNEGNASYAVATSDLPYVLQTQWDAVSRNKKDVWILDLVKNTSEKFKTGMNARLIFSPGGKYLAWYDVLEQQYYAYNFEKKSTKHISNVSDIAFYNEKHDTPSLPSAYGMAAWMESDEALWVYDAFDIWSLDPSGKKNPQNITEGLGRKNKTRLRYIKTDEEKRFVEKKENILLSAFDEKTKEQGFYEIEKHALKKIIVDKYRFLNPKKAKIKATYLFVKSNFHTSPNVYVMKDKWKSEQKLSDINPQMEDYNWGTAEAITWTMHDGKASEGVLYKPEDFDPAKKYPVLIYFYEQVSDNLYNYVAPSPSRSIINISFYCSRGYIVFTPDIHYTTGYPAASAYNAVVSGAEELIKRYPWVDKDNMAIQGQSWGGYQVAHLITRTNMFKAAGSGAPVSNMFSAYGGIRWGTGNSRQYQYEQGQSRIGSTMWDAPELYVENSPIFGVDKVETPVLIMHNDKDGAVPWYQGIEYFMGLRRLGKPAWMLQYNNEEHNLVERRNMKDLSIRMQQFFDHYLKAAPMPEWMKNGVSAMDKGQDYGLQLTK